MTRCASSELNACGKLEVCGRSMTACVASTADAVLMQDSEVRGVTLS
jgi:hypothetical protein